jgi:hypothetical protein
MDLLSAADAGRALIAAGLNVLPAGRCDVHYRNSLLSVRSEVDRLLAGLEGAVN